MLRGQSPGAAPQFLLKDFTFIQLGERGATRGLAGRASREMLGVAVVEMLRQLLDDLVFARRLKPQPREPPSRARVRSVLVR